VCLGTTPISAQLPCGHQFCRGCIEDWAQRCPAGQDRVGCPLCRAPFSAADISDAIPAAPSAVCTALATFSVSCAHTITSPCNAH